VLFLQLQEANPSEDLVNYNLAITEKKLGNAKAAISQFETIIRHSSDDDMKALAQRQLQRLARTNPQSSKQTPGLWTLGTKIEAGNYDN